MSNINNTMRLPIWITSLPRMDNWDYHYNNLLAQHNQYDYKPGNSLKIDDPGRAWDNLYNKFLERTQEILGPLNVHWDHPKQNKFCWLYTANKNHYKGGIHHHLRSSTINGVYYFSVPDSKDYNDSAISFYDGNQNEIWSYRPRELDLIIMPNYLHHQPLPSNSDRYRFSINMEIVCDWPEKFGPNLAIDNFNWTML